MPWVAAAAVLIESMVGYPAPLARTLRHPVVWIGALIDRLDRGLNRETLPDRRRRLNGVAAAAVIVVLPAGSAWALQRAARSLLPGPLATLLLAGCASTLLAQRSLHEHVAAVATALRGDGLPAARLAVGRIVGRDTAGLDEAGVLRAAIESLAENFSDGVTAPLLWCAVGGLPAIVAYKAINTADSMIGHRTDRHLAFGWAAARLDDLVNLPASRLAAFWIALACGRRAPMAWRTVRGSAHLHESPNAGWPEAAMAGALGIRLGGPRHYARVPREAAWIGGGGRNATPEDLDRALRFYRRGCATQALAVLGLAIASSHLAHRVLGHAQDARL